MTGRRFLLAVFSQRATYVSGLGPAVNGRTLLVKAATAQRCKGDPAASVAGDWVARPVLTPPDNLVGLMHKFEESAEAFRDGWDTTGLPTTVADAGAVGVTDLGYGAFEGASRLEIDDGVVDSFVAHHVPVEDATYFPAHMYICWGDVQECDRLRGRQSLGLCPAMARL